MVKNKTPLRIATRKSILALWQANFVKDQLQALDPDLAIELIPFTTAGDRILSTPLSKIGGKGLFVKELEVAILEGKADMAVHCMKDMPAELPDDLVFGVVCERADPRDAFVSNHYHVSADLEENARIGTSSLRRGCQIRARFPQIQCLDLRGNVQTRLRKLDDGEYDAIILAAAGLQRLELENRIKEYFSIEESLPAAGQGVLAIECRAELLDQYPYLQQLEHAVSRQCVNAERVVNRVLGASCQIPVGAYAEIQNDVLHLRALVGEPDGSQLLHASKQGAATDAEKIGEAVANDLLAQGADAILAKLK